MMKTVFKMTQVTYVVGVALLSVCQPVHATISFANQGAGIKLNSGAKLLVGSPILQWTGTLAKGDSSLITGAAITFKEGIWSNGGTDAVVEGVYTTASGESLSLPGDSRIRAEPGYIIPSVFVSGQNNRIEGQPLFAGPISLNDSTTELILALQSKLNQNIQLNGGVLQLDDDIHFADNATLLGPGFVNLNFKSAHFSPRDLVISDSFTFKNAVDVNLHGRVGLSSSWMFSGACALNGHGNVLDLSSGGKLIVPAGATLFLTDIDVRGVKQGSIIFGDDLAKLYLSNAHVELAQRLTTTIGNVVVDGDTWFLLKDLSWTFRDLGSLKVDGVTLWLDVSSEVNGDVPGELDIPSPLYINHKWSLSNEVTGRALGNFSLTHSGTVKEAGGALGLTPTSTEDPCILVRAPLYNDVLMRGNCDVSPIKRIDIRQSITIDGQGARITFSDPDNAQFIVAPKSVVRLKNVSLLRITDKTFDLGQGAVLEIDKDVLFELSDDLILTDDKIRVLGDITDPTVFTMRGQGAQKRFDILPVYQQTPRGLVAVKTFNLGFSTLLLENIELKGLESIAVSREEVPGVGVFVGAMALYNRSTIDINTDTDMSFFVDGPDNELIFMNNNLTVYGFINFSQDYDAELHILCNLGQKIIVPPQINIADDVLYLGSENGRSRLFFDDYAVTLNLMGSNSFVTDVHAFLSGRNIKILTYPIKQTSTDLVLDSPLKITSSMANAVDSGFIRGWKMSRRPKPVFTALELLRQKAGAAAIEKQARRQKALSAPVVPTTVVQTHHHPTQKPRPAKPAKQNKPGKQTNNSFREVQSFETPITSAPQDERSLGEGASPDLQGGCGRACPGLDPGERTATISYSPFRSFTIPTDFNLTVNSRVKLSEAFGPIEVSNGTVTEFGTHATEKLDIYLRGGAWLEQNVVETTFKEIDEIFVEGEDNHIIVKKKMIFYCPIKFNENSHLIIEFDKKAKNAVVIFAGAIEQPIEMPAKTRIEFRGQGTVWFQDGTKFIFQGTTPEDGAMLAFTESVVMRMSDQINLEQVGPATVQIQGIGRILVDSGSTVNVEGGQQIIVGQSKQDDIELLVDRGSWLSVSGLSQNDGSIARFSIQKATSTIAIDDGSTLDIGKNGVLEINALNGTNQGGAAEIIFCC